MAEMALIQAASMACQAASATVVSKAVETTGSGGRLRRILVPYRGGVHCSKATTVSFETTTFAGTAFLLVASGIKNSGLCSSSKNFRYLREY